MITLVKIMPYKNLHDSGKIKFASRALEFVACLELLVPIRG